MKEKIINLLIKLTNLKEAEISQLIEPPPDEKLGDYAFPCFVLSKTIRKSPKEIAKELAKKINPSEEIEKVEAIGPYVNFFLNIKNLAESTLKKIQKEKDKYGSYKMNKKIVIEYIGPNTNKPLHVGHVRNIVIGQSIANILKHTGNKITMVNINSDRGIHICKSIVAYEKFGKNDSPEKAGKKPDHFIGDYYVKFAQKLKTNPELEKEAHECLRKWEAGDKKTLALWKKMNVWALQGFKKTYKKFDIHIDKEYFESKIYKEGRKIILDALKKGILIKKDNAIIADLKKFNLDEKVLLRADGTSLYITQDIYLALLRKKEYNFDKMLYIVANEQNYHFKVLFALLELFGYKWHDQLHHLSYGMVNLESGKMKSREGNVIDADDLVEEIESLALKEIESRYKNLEKKEKLNRAKAIAMASIRYYFLKIEKIKDITFKPEEAINFEGNTGPYLLYTYARAKSILRKAKYSQNQKYKIGNVTEKEKQLLIHLSNFPEIILSAHNALATNLVANYAYNISQIFNEFYHAEKIIGSVNEPFKLALVDAFSQVLKNALSLLNIQPLEIM